MFSFIKTNSDNSDFQRLAARLEEELKILDGDDHVFYAQLNKVETLKYAIVAYQDGKPAGCGALHQHSNDAMEIKRMYTIPEKRGLGIATKILTRLENQTSDLGYRKCMLETGYNQPGAIAFYTKNGYTVIPNFGKYANSANSVCFEKVISGHKS